MPVLAQEEESAKEEHLPGASAWAELVGAWLEVPGKAAPTSDNFALCAFVARHGH